MNPPSPIPRRPSRAGFSLVEVALAVTIVAIVILAAIGLIVPAQRAIEEVLTTDQATRLRAELEKEFTVVRPGEQFTSGFDKAYQILKKPGEQDSMLCAFFYRAKKPTGASGTSATRPDGRLEAFTEAIDDKRPGEDYLVQAAVMPFPLYDRDKDIKEAIEGRVFLIRLTYLKGLLAPESDSAFGSRTSDNFPEAVLPATADFFVAEDSSDLLPDINRIKEGFIKPVLSLNVGFNR